MSWTRRNWIPLMGIFLLVLAVLSVLQFSYQQGRMENAVRCQNGLLRVVMNRSSAANDERTALRALLLGLRDDGVSDSDLSNFRGYEYAIARADQVYASDGKVEAAQQLCADLQ